MSSHHRIVLPWIVQRTRLPLLALRCVDCGASRFTTGEGKVRINANGKLLDVWLLVNCLTCDRTNKITIHDRVQVRSLDPGELQAYEANDPALVARALLDPQIARRNRYNLDWNDAWRLITSPEGRPATDDHPASAKRLITPSVPTRRLGTASGEFSNAAWPIRIEVIFHDPVPVRPERLIAQGLGVSRTEARDRIKIDIPLNRKVSTAFAFIVLPRA